MKKRITFFSKGELILWSSSAGLIVLWALAAAEDISYLSVIICFVMFLVNDLYGFVSWKRMEKRQLQTA